MVVLKSKPSMIGHILGSTGELVNKLESQKSLIFKQKKNFVCNLLGQNYFQKATLLVVFQDLPENREPVPKWPRWLTFCFGNAK